MSIQPEFVERIINNEKKWEFRNVFGKANVDRIYIYSSFPVQKIVGYFIPGKIIRDSPDWLWAACQPAGIEKSKFNEYFSKKHENLKDATRAQLTNMKDKDLAKAIEITEFHEFKNQITLSDIDPGLKPPQNYRIIFVSKTASSAFDFNNKMFCAKCGFKFGLNNCPQCNSNEYLIFSNKEFKLHILQNNNLEAYLK
jgi:predicted transcriptional regulator